MRSDGFSIAGDSSVHCGVDVRVTYTPIPTNSHHRKAISTPFAKRRARGHPLPNVARMALSRPTPIIDRAIALNTDRPRASGPSPTPKRCQDIKAHSESDATVLTIRELLNTS